MSDLTTGELAIVVTAALAAFLLVAGGIAAYGIGALGQQASPQSGVTGGMMDGMMDGSMMGGMDGSMMDGSMMDDGEGMMGGPMGESMMGGATDRTDSSTGSPTSGMGCR